MKVHGRCHCGAIRYEADVDPARVQVCHCTDCQTLSGAPFRAIVPVPIDKFVLHGEPKRYIKTAQSGNKRAQGFCGDCGTPIYSTSTDDKPALYMVRAGSIKQRGALVPKFQIWQSSAQPWTAHIDEIPLHTGGMPPYKL